MTSTGPAGPWTHAVSRAYDGVRLLTCAGRGDTRLLLHGWPASGTSGRPVIPPLAAHRDVIVPDLRGFATPTSPTSARGGYARDAVAREIDQAATRTSGWRAIRGVAPMTTDAAASASSRNGRDVIRARRRSRAYPASADVGLSE